MVSEHSSLRVKTPPLSSAVATKTLHPLLFAYSSSVSVVSPRSSSPNAWRVVAAAVAVAVAVAVAAAAAAAAAAAVHHHQQIGPGRECA